METKHKPPQGYRRLNVGEVIEENDLVNARGNPDGPGFCRVFSALVGRPVEDTGGMKLLAFYRVGGINVELLRKIQQQILAEPLQFMMSDWFISRPEVPNCGTTACIAGWAQCLLSEQNPRQAKEITGMRKYDVQKALGITGDQAERLFYASNWPKIFISQYIQALENNDPVRKARVASERIEHFIRTNGDE